LDHSFEEGRRGGIYRKSCLIYGLVKEQECKIKYEKIKGKKTLVEHAESRPNLDFDGWKG